MRHSILYSVIVLAALTGCGKDKFETRPGLTFGNASTSTVYPGQRLVFSLNFTDKEGDISNTIFVQKIVTDCAGSNFEDTYTIPSFPSSSNQKGEIQVVFGYNAGNETLQIAPQCARDETAVFRFAITDKKNNTSDTITSPPIKIVYQ